MSTTSSRRSRCARGILLATVAAMSLTSEAMAQEARRRFNIPSQDATTALQAYARQSGRQVLFSYDAVRGRRAPTLRGEYSNEEALNRLIRGTGLVVTSSDGSTVTLASGEAEAGSAAADDGSADAGATPDILVVGQRTLNADIRRTENDTQPYVVFSREEIARSPASDLGEFFRTRLPMNTQQSSTAGSALATNRSGVNLRGLGLGQTLILVNGRRLPNSSSNPTTADVIQPDINGIPLASIERIEVLPSTASGIYGGGATGGVINIITRLNYSGIEARMTYGMSFRGDAGHRRIDLSGGFGLEDGRTQVMFAGSISDSDGLVIGGRDFAARARALQLRNNPAAFFGAVTNASQLPIGFTSNIRNTTNANLILDNGTVLSSPFTFVPQGYAGRASDGGAALAANAGQYNLALPEDFDGARRSLLNEPTLASFTVNARREFGRSVEAYFDISWQRNRGRIATLGGVTGNSVTLPADSPSNPFTTAVHVRFPALGIISRSQSDTEILRSTAGVIVRLSRAWTAAADVTLSRTEVRLTQTSPVVGDPDGTGPEVSFATALSNGSVNVIRDLNVFRQDYTPYLLPAPNNVLGPFRNNLFNLAARLSGPLVELPAGRLNLSFLAEHRNEEVEDGNLRTMNANAVVTTLFFPARRQRINSAYVETRIPLFSSANAIPLIQELELQASLRHDDYRTRSPFPSSVTLPATPTLTSLRNSVASTTYALGLRYSPVQDLILRASLGSGFLPPTVDQIVPGTSIANASTTLIDPKRGGTSGTVGPFLFSQGGNTGLIPEESGSWSVGFVFAPSFLPGFRLSVDYTNIRKTNEIVSLTPQQLLNLEDDLPGRVSRNALTPADAARGFTAGTISAIDTTLINLGATRVEAFDAQVDHQWESEQFGRFHLYALATWQRRFARRAAANSPFIDTAGFTGGPLRFRGNGGLTWTLDDWTFAWNAQYYGRYRAYVAGSTAAAITNATLNQGSATIPSQSYHDLSISYRFGRRIARSLQNLELTVGVQNVFDQSPPILATTGVSETFSAYGDPRLRRFTLSARTAF